MEDAKKLADATTGAPGSAQVRAEIMEHVIDPCFREIAKASELPGLSLDEAVQVAKTISGDAMDDMIESVRSVVENTNGRDDRMLIYTLGLRTCIDAALAE